MARRPSVSDDAGGVSDGRRAGMLLSGRRVAGRHCCGHRSQAQVGGTVHVWRTRVAACALLVCC
eukprot:11385193-Alexandrium_andersonii.AAC.1